MNDKAIMEGSNYKRDNFSLKLNTKPVKNVTLDFSARYSDTDIKGGGANDVSSTYDSDKRLKYAVIYTPIPLSNLDASAGSSDDDLGNLYHPLTAISDNDREQERKTLNIAGSFGWEIFKNFKIKTEVGYDDYRNSDQRYWGLTTYYIKNVPSDANQGKPAAQFANTSRHKFRNTNTISYDFSKLFKGDIVPILIITLVTLVGKLIFSSLGVLLSGQTLKNAVHCGCSLAQIGEFAFIIASLGLSLGVIADYIYPIIVSVSIITTLTTPSFIKGSDKLYEWLEKVLPSRLTEKLARYTDEEQSSKEKNGDWSAYLGRYVKVTAFYGVVMLGIALIGSLVLLPLLGKLGLEPWLEKLICLAVVYIGMAIFIRPMLDMKSPQFTTLWVKNRNFRLPLMALTAIRVLIIVIIAFIPANTVSGVAGLWLLPLILAAVLLIYRSGWFASAYLSVEARFLANFNERQLQRLDSDDAVEWLDQRLHVLSFQYEQHGGTLKELGWGKRFGVNVIKIVRGKRHISIPSGDTALHSGDTVYILGESAELRNLCLDLGIAEPAELPTLREFIAAEDSEPEALYSYAISVDKGSELAGKTVRDSGIRDNYDCMVLGLQRSRLPIVQPDVNMQIQNGDLVWVLGAKAMAGKLLASVVEEN